MPNPYSAILDNLSKAPDSQINKTIAARLAEMAQKDSVKAEEMKEVLDMCAFTSLASDFGMVAMDAVWCLMLRNEQEADRTT